MNKQRDRQTHRYTDRQAVRQAGGRAGRQAANIIWQSVHLYIICPSVLLSKGRVASFAIHSQMHTHTCWWRPRAEDDIVDIIVYVSLGSKKPLNLFLKLPFTFGAEHQVLGSRARKPNLRSLHIVPQGWAVRRSGSDRASRPQGLHGSVGVQVSFAFGFGD